MTAPDRERDDAVDALIEELVDHHAEVTRLTGHLIRERIRRRLAEAKQLDDSARLAALVRAWGNVDPGDRMTRSTAAGLIAALIENTSNEGE